MVIRLGRNGKFLACSNYPEHKETRPLPGEETPVLEGDGETCPQCGEGTLQTRRGRYGAFVGCSRYPDCTFIKKEGPPPPDQLPFEVTCPKNADGHLVARRARRTGNVFWGCSAYPRCDFTTNDEPTGAVHDADDALHADGRGSVARKGEAGMCMTCGATVELPDGRPRGSPAPGWPAQPRGARACPRRGPGGAARVGGASGRDGGPRAQRPAARRGAGSGSRRASA